MVEFNAVATSIWDVGICDNDLSRIDAKEGDWLRIEYDGQGTNAQVTKVPRKEGWASNIIFMKKAIRDKMKLPENIENKISDSRATKPSDVYMNVWKHTLPRGQRFYTAIVTLILTVFGALFKGATEFLPDSDPLKFPFGIATLLIVIIGAVGAFVAVVFLEKQ
jgi:hypothetical protein